MNKIEFTDEEYSSLELILNYLADSEEKHYEESDKCPNHIYAHVAKIQQLVRMK